MSLCIKCFTEHLQMLHECFGLLLLLIQSLQWRLTSGAAKRRCQSPRALRLHPDAQLPAGWLPPQASLLLPLQAGLTVPNIRPPRVRSQPRSPRSPRCQLPASKPATPSRAGLHLMVGSWAVSPASGSQVLPSFCCPCSSFLCRSLSWHGPPTGLVQEDPGLIHR